MMLVLCLWLPFWLRLRGSRRTYQIHSSLQGKTQVFAFALGDRFCSDISTAFNSQTSKLVEPESYWGRNFSSSGNRIAPSTLVSLGLERRLCLDDRILTNMAIIDVEPTIHELVVSVRLLSNRGRRSGRRGGRRRGMGERRSP